MQTLDDMSHDRRRRRSMAWVYYLLLTVGVIVGGFSHPALFLAAVPLGLYSRYLFRGGRTVIWFW